MDEQIEAIRTPAFRQFQLNLYNSYKPLRNFTRRLSLLDSLVHIWHLAGAVIEGVPLPYGFSEGVTRIPAEVPLHPWHVGLLCREVILHAGKQGDRSLRKWPHLATAINHILRVENDSFTANGIPMDVMVEMHRISHRQFPWQGTHSVSTLMRAFKVFGADAIDQIVQREMGLSARNFVRLGMAVAGHFRSNYAMSTNQDYSVLGVSREASDSFFGRLTIPIERLRQELQGLQKYDWDWPYTWNPLESTPLISFDPSHPDRVVCPITRYISNRTTGGLFFDLVRKPDFGEPFGKSFERYIGEVLDATCPSPNFSKMCETPYVIDGNVHHGVDWILSDQSGHLFIEGKTKRMTVNAKTRSDSIALDKDLETIGKAVVQHYANIQHAIEGRTYWKPDGLPVYPLIVTLEDWFLLGTTVEDKLLQHVTRLLEAEGLPPSLADNMPFLIVSISELEAVGQVLSELGIHPVLSRKLKETMFRSWGLLNFVKMQFPEQTRRVNWRLFGGELATYANAAA